MFIAHLPAGYLTTRLLLRRRRLPDGIGRRLLALGLVASVLPDLDLFYFYLIDARQTLHHEYWPHLPVFWAALAAPLLGAAVWTRRLEALLAWLVFHLNILLHLVLDSVVGHVLWFYPLSDRTVVLFDVPTVHGWWVWNFVLHWTFLFELAICVAAAMLALRRRLATAKAGDG